MTTPIRLVVIGAGEVMPHPLIVRDATVAQGIKAMFTTMHESPSEEVSDFISRVKGRIAAEEVGQENQNVWGQRLPTVLAIIWNPKRLSIDDQEDGKFREFIPNC